MQTTENQHETILAELKGGRPTNEEVRERNERKRKEIVGIVKEQKDKLKGIKLRSLPKKASNPFYDPDEILRTGKAIYEPLGVDEKRKIVDIKTREESDLYKAEKVLRNRKSFTKVGRNTAKDIAACYLLVRNKLATAMYMYIVCEGLKVNQDKVMIHPLDIQERFYDEGLKMNMTFFYESIAILCKLGIIYPSVYNHIYYVNINRIINGDIFKIALARKKEEKIKEEENTFEVL